MSALVHRFGRNTKGRDLLVGDIHGHFTRLQAALDAAGFDPARVMRGNPLMADTSGWATE